MRQREHLRRRWESKLARDFDYILSKIEGEALVVTHKNPDPDAAGAAVGFAEIARAYGVYARIAFPEGPSKSVKKLLDELDLEVPYETRLTSRPPGCKWVVSVDTANPSQLGEFEVLLRSPETRVVVIDHHAVGGISKHGSFNLIVSDATSTSEIISYAARSLRIPLSPSVASLVYAGILVDTRWLRQTGPFTFEALSYLLDMGANTSKVFSALRASQERDLSERIALLKAASRLQLARVCKDILVVVSHVGSFEASAARALIDLGADIAVVAKDSPEGVRISIRVSPRAESYNITANAIASYIAGKLGGEGGGHSGAAGVLIRTQRLSAELVAQQLARSLPGKIARLCVEARRLGGAKE